MRYYEGTSFNSVIPIKEFIMSILAKSFFATLALCAVTLPASAAFVVLDNFESYADGSDVTDTTAGELGAVWTNNGFGAGEMTVVNEGGNNLLSIE
ncbi:MAG: hypothetical protein ACP5I4_17380, partial [Oceanipulchritudo sp.]